MASTLKIKRELIELIEAQEDVSVLKAIKTLLNVSTSDLKPITKEELIERALQSEEDINNGSVFSLEEVREISKNW